MMTRTTSRTVTFTKPFEIADVRDTFPAGEYVIETDEEVIEGVSFLSYRRFQTHLHQMDRSITIRTLTVDPADLDRALVNDGGGLTKPLSEKQKMAPYATPEKIERVKADEIAKERADSEGMAQTAATDPATDSVTDNK